MFCGWLFCCSPRRGRFDLNKKITPNVIMTKELVSLPSWSEASLATEEKEGESEVNTTATTKNKPPDHSSPPPPPPPPPIDRQPVQMMTFPPRSQLEVSQRPVSFLAHQPLPTSQLHTFYQCYNQSGRNIPVHPNVIYIPSYH